MEIIIICLEEFLYNMLYNWLEDLKNENVLIKFVYDVIVEIEVIYKFMVFDSYKNIDDVFILKEFGI